VLVQAGKPYFNFINRLRSEATKKEYDWAFRVFLEHYELTSDKLAETDPKDIEALIIDYVVLLKSQKKSYSLMDMMSESAIKHFCVMNDIRIVTTKINKFKGEKAKDESAVDDRAYTHEEIKILIDSAPIHLKVILLIMASTGVRV